jgi:phospholipase C
MGSHFYNGAGRDWFGKPTAVTTYALAQTTVKNKSGDARSNARKRVEQVKSLSQPDSCYQLGLALHYATDSTQPMHTSGLAATDYSINLHPVWESYVPVIQTRFPAAGWDKRFVNLSPDETVHQIAVRSNGFAKKLVEVVDPHKLPICTYEPVTGILYTGRCFRNEANVDAVTGEILRDAYQSAASFLYVTGKSRL